MDTPTRPQIYLITSATADQDGFSDLLNACLDRVQVGCVRLRMASQDVDVISRTADQCRLVTDAHDVALVIDSHVALVQRLGLDGVHLLDGARSVAAMRKELGPDAIVGAFCGTSQHDGMTAGERGADYISFGPAADTGLGDGAVAETDLFAWWSQMVELPVVAEGGMSDEVIRTLAPHSDFIALGDEVWRHDDPAAELARLDQLLG